MRSFSESTIPHRYGVSLRLFCSCVSGALKVHTLFMERFFTTRNAELKRREVAIDCLIDAICDSDMLMIPLAQEQVNLMAWLCRLSA
jgi:hypothetical protein